MSKFLRLHNCENNSVVIVDMNRVACIDTTTHKDRNVSTLYLDNTSDIEEFQVNESPEKIFEMLNESNK